MPKTTSPSVTDIKTDANRPAKLGWWLVIAGFGGFLGWAFFAPLDRGVAVTGTVMVSGNKKAVQHLHGGTVEQILVKEGDVVRAGKVLVRMNSVQARSLAETTRVQYLNAMTTEARLLAERDQHTTIRFPDEVTRIANTNPSVAATLTVQRQLFSARLAALRGEVATLEQNIGGLQSLLQGIRESQEGKRHQFRLLQEQIDASRDLAKEGYMPRNRLLELERNLAQIGAALSEDTGAIGRSQSQIGELRLQMLQVQQNHQKELRSQLADVQQEANALRSRLEGLDHDVANAEVKSSVDGMVADLAIFTEGGVVAPGFRMMDIVPLNEPLVVEGQVPVHLIDSVHAGLNVELIFSSFNVNTTPRVPGTVTQVSPDRLVDERTGVPYYRLRAEASVEGRKVLSALLVRPGMPVELFVSTGERTLANYLLRPFVDHLRVALTED